ncbi:bidirectional sugar transporter SWEET17-like isoform X3 [Primulina eburnea]|uniref:bidirectional sugar transporter SWEET17-like isoform X3 n=1 Tax=Primulina eburnea TaxID=1245227 RepID=UPI003C6C1B53
MVELLLIVGVIGNIISVLMFLSPVKTFWRIVKNRSTEEFESLAYICTLLNSSLWTYYGIIKPGSYLVATVNGFGVVVETVYVFLFLLCAPPFQKGKTAILFGILNVGFLAAVLCVTYLLLNGDMRINATGYMASGLNIVMYGSPLAGMVPNVIGFLLGALQLFLYAIYKNPRPSKDKGWMTQRLLPSTSDHNATVEP